MVRSSGIARASKYDFKWLGSIYVVLNAKLGGH